MAKFVGKFRQHRDYDDDYSFGKDRKSKKKKNDYREQRKMKAHRYDEPTFETDDSERLMRAKL